MGTLCGAWCCGGLQEQGGGAAQYARHQVQDYRAVLTICAGSSSLCVPFAVDVLSPDAFSSSMNADRWLLLTACCEEDLADSGLLLPMAAWLHLEM